MKVYIVGLLLFCISIFSYTEEKEHWEYSFIRALNYEEKEEIDKAIDELEISRKLRPEDPLILRELGYCYGKKGKFMKAKECYEKVLELYPEDENALQNLSFLNTVLEGNKKNIKE